ncbi:colorectal mutant cancer protein-like isoform X3 [Acanthaster planci]|uniref:Colorectal mutant cancer protein-like isoform X3 n=1 Tax=Acanthaster planci TaxID=133434 RepID=A0A8B7Y2Y6_ACAPL|nr:colorectal mutant cancer protein-like isoform X3 [Acanthaster planci]
MVTRYQKSSPMSKPVDFSDGSSSVSDDSLYEPPENKLHLAALASLKGEIIELTNRLQRVSAERDVLDKKLGKAQVERSRLLRENEDRLDQQAVRYEERITELHSVIAELNKKIDRSHGVAFREEDEFSQSASSPHSNISNSGGSCNGSFQGSDSANIDQCNDLSAELSRVVGELECAVEERKGTDTYRQHIDTADHTIKQLASASHQVEKRSLEAVQEVERLQYEGGSATDHSPATPNGFQGHAQRDQHRRRSSLEQELDVLRDENENLNTTLSMKEDELQKIKANLIAIRDERDKLRKKVRDQQSRNTDQLPGASASNLKQQQHQQGYTSSSSEQLSSPGYRPTPNPSNVNANSALPNGEQLGVYGSERRGGMPVAKVAERVRLKPSRSLDSSSRSGSEKGVTGSDLNSVGLTNPKVAEHLARSLQECSSVQEILQALGSHGLPVPESKAREIEVEMERLHSKIEHLRSQNDLLQLTLEESKSNADRLTLLTGKYESNNTALQLAVSYADQAAEAFDVLLMLLETEQQVLLANCRAAGVGGFGTGESSEGSDSEETTMMLKRVHENRKAAENMAKALLQRLDRSCGTMVCHVPGCTLQPWEDVSSHSHTSTTSSTASSCDTEFTKEDEQRLRDYIQQLKNDKAAVRLTVLELESVHIDAVPSSSSSSGQECLKTDSQRLDLENAVMMQEIAALKEEKAELKAQFYLLEKEKKAAELKMSSRDAQEQAYLAQIDHLKAEVEEKKSKDVVPRSPKQFGMEPTSTPSVTLAELSHLEDPSISADVAEMARREKKLRAKIHELMATIEKLQKSSEMRHQQSAEFIADLKRANSALVTAYDKAKKKHQNRLKKLEAQMMAMVERHDTQVRMLKQRIALLEEENQATRPPHNETSL